MKKPYVLADHKTAEFLSKLSKQALVDLCFDLALQVHGEEDEFREAADTVLRELAGPVLRARGDRVPK